MHTILELLLLVPFCYWRFGSGLQMRPRDHPCYWDLPNRNNPRWEKKREFGNRSENDSNCERGNAAEWVLLLVLLHSSLDGCTYLLPTTLSCCTSKIRHSITFPRSTVQTLLTCIFIKIPHLPHWLPLFSSVVPSSVYPGILVPVPDTVRSLWITRVTFSPFTIPRLSQIKETSSRQLELLLLLHPQRQPVV
ncbi:hypothetical protein BJX61DRAFT_506983 [Aspergillus egyptiacus]|nr:hypothetical protein BJX61DRAFT_506983 [Aspergillus egyptiacus]